MLAINQLFAIVTDDNSKAPSMHRLLWQSKQENIVYTINISQSKGMPVRRAYSDVETALELGHFEVIVNDKWDFLRGLGPELSKSQLETRNKRWSVIEAIVSRNDGKQYSRQGRSELRKKHVSIKTPKKTVYSLLRLYFQRGQMKNALIPQFDKCGAKGKKKKYKAKPGRKSRLEKERGIQVGPTMTSEIKELLIQGIKRFYLNRKEYSLKQAYQKTLEAYFKEGIRFDEEKDVLVPNFPDLNKLPTYHQFENLYRKTFKSKQKMISREGLNKYLLTGRATLSDVSAVANHPGDQYEADATVVDLYLRSQFDALKTVTRPHLSLIVDTVSRSITGFYLGFRHPSWKTGASVVSSAILDKVAVCKSKVIDIELNEWPQVGAPRSILADQGEFASYHADAIPDSLGIELMNAPAYRADYKPIVERTFGIFNNELFRHLPGFVTERNRGDDDYREKARLNIAQLRKMILEFILHYNNERVMKEYPLTKEMIEDGVRPIPNEIWKWGITNLSGQLRPMKENVVKRNLLMRGKATVTQSGIQFKKLLYHSDFAAKNDWYSTARIQKTWKIDILFDVNDTDVIYRVDSSGIPEQCHLLEKATNQPYQSCNWAEVELLREYLAIQIQDETQREINPKAKLNALIQKTIEESSSPEFERNERTRTKVDKLRDIRENSNLELLGEIESDRLSKFHSDSPSNTSASNETPNTESDQMGSEKESSEKERSDESYIPPKSYLSDIANHSDDDTEQS